MSTYRYSESPIKEVTFKKTGNGAIRAYLQARGDLDSQALQDVLGGLKAGGLECIPYSFDGKAALEVRGFSRDTHLIRQLEGKGYVKGKADVLQDKEDPISWMDKLRKRSLQASGLAMSIADVGFITYGMKEAEIHRHASPNQRRDFSEALAGFCYLAGSTTLGLYGRNDQSRIQIREMAQTILKQAKERGFDVPENSAVAQLGHKRKESPLARLNTLFHKYPSEIGNMFYFGAGALIAQSAIRNRVLKPMPQGKFDWGGVGDTALGSSTMLAGLIATFVKEKAPDPDKEKHKGVQGWVDWMKTHPLSMAGALYIGSTACHSWTTYFDLNKARETVSTVGKAAREVELAHFKLEAIPWRILFVGATLVGELLLAISSKGHGEGVVSDNSVDNSMIAMAADLIVKQPAHRQEALIDYMAGFLGRSDVLAMKDEEACKQLRLQVEALRNNPWAQAVHAYQQQEGQHAPAVNEADAPCRKCPEEKLPAWQAKMAARDSQPIQPRGTL